MGTGRRPLFALLLLVVTGCGAPSEPISPPSTSSPAVSSLAPRPAPASTPTRAVRPEPSPAPPAAPPPTARSRTGPDDPRWRFFVDDDKARYRSLWFDGAQRVMIGYGCTRAPFYVPDSRCRGVDGFHHGVDVALPCRTTIRAGVAGRVLEPSRPGRPGPAYGSTAFRLRVTYRRSPLRHRHRARDPGAGRAGRSVRRGQVIALAGARGAPDGCHLHFEQRRPDTGVTGAKNPTRLLALRPV